MLHLLQAVIEPLDLFLQVTVFRFHRSFVLSGCVHFLSSLEQGVFSLLAGCKDYDLLRLDRLLVSSGSAAKLILGFERNVLETLKSSVLFKRIYGDITTE